jgi:MFS family permease
LRGYATIVFVGLSIAVYLLSRANTILVLVVGLLLVRWLGQGMMSHTSSTGMAKYFGDNRGKALGITMLGHPAGQFFLPLIVVPLVGLFGWQNGLLYTLLGSIILMIPTIWMVNDVDARLGTRQTSQAQVKEKTSDYLKSKVFWIIAANVFIVPFICTAVFLYQYTMGESKGWSMTWIAFSFAFYAVFNAIAILASGPLVDRFSGILLFPLYLIPALLGIILVASSNHPYTGPLFFALLGISSGLGSTIKTSMQAEIYGTGELGKVKSYFSTILVLSTALGPPLFGFCMDKGIPVHVIMWGCVFLVITALYLSTTLWTSDQQARAMQFLGRPGKWFLAWVRVRN